VFVIISSAHTHSLLSYWWPCGALSTLKADARTHTHSLLALNSDSRLQEEPQEGDSVDFRGWRSEIIVLMIVLKHFIYTNLTHPDTGSKDKQNDLLERFKCFYTQTLSAWWKFNLKFFMIWCFNIYIYIYIYIPLKPSYN